MTIIASAALLVSATVWEGVTDVVSAGDLPGGSFSIATNSFPRNTIVDIVNLENGKMVRVKVVSGLETTGLLATLSRTAADSIDLRGDSTCRIRMTQPSDDIAFSHFRLGPIVSPPSPVSELETPAENVISSVPVLPAEASATAGAVIAADSSAADEVIPTRSAAAVNNAPPSRNSAAAKNAVAAKNTATTKNAPETDNVPPVENSSATNNAATPRNAATAKNAAAAKNAPPADNATVTNNAVAAGSVPAADYAPPAEQSTVTNNVIAAGSVPVADYAPPADNATVTNNAIAAGSVPATDYAPPAENATMTNNAVAAAEPAAAAVVTAATVTENAPEPGIAYGTLSLLPAEERPPEEITRFAIAPEAGAAYPPLSSSDFSPFPVPLISSLEPDKWYVQVGVYTHPDYVEDEINRIGMAYPLAIQNIGTDTSPMFRVLLGPLNQGESGAMLQRFKSIGYADAFVRHN